MAGGSASGIDRGLTMELVRVTERAAVAAARLRGRGDEIAADRVAVEAARAELGRLPVRGRIVIGEGKKDSVPALWVGETVGTGRGPEVDVAIDPLEGSTICAKHLPNALSVVAVAERGGLLRVPDLYMDKIAVGPGYPEGVIEFDASPAENLARLAAAKGVPVRDLTACILDRPRHARLIAAVREAGAAIRLIGDGDVAGVIHATDPEATGVDIYLGIGGAPEGVLAAAALRCTGGQMQGRLVIDTHEKAERARVLGIEDPRRIYGITDLARGEVLFAATGVTDGNLLSGVRFGRDSLTTDTIVMRSSSRTVRQVRARHRDLDKFDPGGLG